MQCNSPRVELHVFVICAFAHIYELALNELVCAFCDVNGVYSDVKFEI